MQSKYSPDNACTQRYAGVTGDTVLNVMITEIRCRAGSIWNVCLTGLSRGHQVLQHEARGWGYQ